MNKMGKREWLDNLYYQKGKQRHDFFLCGTYEEKGETKFSKWRTYLDCVATLDEINHNERWKDRKFFEDINQRQILKNEVVLDLEDPTQLQPIVQQIKEWGWEDWFVYSTGSRGYHIHIFFKDDFTESEKESVVNKFGTDIQKCSDKNLIALENCPHWKTGRLKREIMI